MDIRQLKYFRAIAAEGTISEAANSLFMTQPALSHQLQLLEAELTVKLIDRGSRRIKLTEAGVLLNNRAEQILSLLSTTATELKELHDGTTGTLSIGTIASLGVTLLPGLIHDFTSRYPNIKFNLWEGDTPRIVELLGSGLIELGFVRAAFDPQSYHSLSLPPDPLIIAMSAGWDCGEHAEPISLAGLADKPLLLHRSHEAMIIEGCRGFGFEPNIRCKGDDVRTILVLANEGIGLAVVPKSALGLVPSSKIHSKEIAGSPLAIEKSVIWMRQRYLSTAARHFLDSLAVATSQP